jgi:hypothetical protein
MAWRKHVLLYLATTMLGVLLLWQYGSLGTTYDETADLRISTDIQKGRNPFANTEIPSQTRLVFYLHAIVSDIYNDLFSHYLISTLSILFLLWVWYFFLYTHAGKQAAHILLLLMLTSIPLLTAGRHLLTHSNAVFTLFFSLSFIQFYTWVTRKEIRHLYFAAVFAGLSMASSLLGVFAILPLICITITCRHDIRWNATHLIGAIAATISSFLLTTIIYLDPDILYAAVKETFEGHSYSYWNYLNTGQPTAPIYFSWVVFIIRIHPAIALIFLYACLLLWKGTDVLHRYMAGACAGIFLFLIIKSGIFHYDAPHHQVQFIPLAYAAVSIAVAQLMTSFQQKLLRIAAFAFSVHQVVLIYQCYPNFLFYGAQYGSRFIGQFYGPAVVHGLGVNELHHDVNHLLKQHPGADVLKQENSATRLSGESFVNFQPTDSLPYCMFAVSSYLDLHHLQYEDSRAFDTILQHDYRIIKTYYYPWGVPMFTLHQHR